MAYTIVLLKDLEIWFSASIPNPVVIIMSTLWQKNFYDFLSSILATQNTNSMQQVILWDKQMFKSFMNAPENIEYAKKKEVTDTLKTIRMELGVMPMEKPFEYIKELQRDFPYEHICFSNEYYDALGLERPDGTEPDENGFEFDAVAFCFEKIDY